MDAASARAHVDDRRPFGGASSGPTAGASGPARPFDTQCASNSATEWRLRATRERHASVTRARCERLRVGKTIASKRLQESPWMSPSSIDARRRRTTERRHRWREKYDRRSTSRDKIMHGTLTSMKERQASWQEMILTMASQDVTEDAYGMSRDTNRAAKARIHPCGHEHASSTRQQNEQLHNERIQTEGYPVCP